MVCSNKDGLDAHMRGSKHSKVVNLHKRMGKPIPPPSTDGGASGKTVMVTAPRCVYVGGVRYKEGGYIHYLFVVDHHWII